MYVKVCNRKLSYGNICLAIAVYSVFSLLGHFYWKVENMLFDLSCTTNIYTFRCVDDLLGFVVFSTGLLMAIFLGIASTTVMSRRCLSGSISLLKANWFPDMPSSFIRSINLCLSTQWFLFYFSIIRHCW